MESAKRKDSGLLLLLGAGMIIFLLLIGVSNIFHFTYSINADIASDAILGREIWESKEIIPDTWYVAEETRIICTPNVAALFYGMTHNIMLSAGLACSTMTILILLSALYLGKLLRFCFRESLLFGFLCLIIPFAPAILGVLYLYASYYAVHVVIWFFTLGVYLEAVREKQIKWGKMAVAMLLSLILGVQGARGILVIYGPLFGMEVIRNLYGIYCKEKKKRADFLISLWVFFLLVVSFAGMLNPLSVGQEFSRNIRNGFQKLWTAVIPDMGKAMGFAKEQPANNGCIGIFMMLAVYLLADILYRMYKKKEIEEVEWGFLAIFSSPIVSALMVAFTTVESTDRYYFQFVYVMAYAVVLFFRKWKFRTRFKSWIPIGICLVTIILSMTRFAGVYLPILRSEEPQKSHSYEVVRFLEDEGIKTAYTTFDNANVMTAMVNGRVRVAPVESVGTMAVCKWMSSTAWYVPNVPYKAKTAYIIPESKVADFLKFLKMHREDIQFKTKIGRFLIYYSDYNFSHLDVF